MRYSWVGVLAALTVLLATRAAAFGVADPECAQCAFVRGRNKLECCSALSCEYETTLSTAESHGSTCSRKLNGFGATVVALLAIAVVVGIAGALAKCCLCTTGWCSCMRKGGACRAGGGLAVSRYLFGARPIGLALELGLNSAALAGMLACLASNSWFVANSSALLDWQVGLWNVKLGGKRLAFPSHKPFGRLKALGVASGVVLALASALMLLGLLVRLISLCARTTHAPRWRCQGRAVIAGLIFLLAYVMCFVSGVVYRTQSHERSIRADAVLSNGSAYWGSASAACIYCLVAPLLGLAALIASGCTRSPTGYLALPSSAPQQPTAGASPAALLHHSEESCVYDEDETEDDALYFSEDIDE